MNKEKTWDVQKSLQYQKDKNNFFVPPTGRCYKCGKNIFEPHEGLFNGEKYTSGYSVEDSKNDYITNCPHCYMCFAD